MAGHLVRRARDVVHQVTRVRWHGDDATKFPWGTEKDHERLTYEARDTEAAASSVLGEADTTVELHDRVLVWRVWLELRSNRTEFVYRFKREVRANGRLIREKTWEEAIPRDHQ